MSSIPTGLFNGLAYLTDIWFGSYIGGNKLTTIPSGLFNGLNNLQRIIEDYYLIDYYLIERRSFE